MSWPSGNWECSGELQVELLPSSTSSVVRLELWDLLLNAGRRHVSHMDLHAICCCTRWVSRDVNARQPVLLHGLSRSDAALASHPDAHGTLWRQGKTLSHVSEMQSCRRPFETVSDGVAQHTFQSEKVPRAVEVKVSVAGHTHDFHPVIAWHLTCRAGLDLTLLEFIQKLRRANFLPWAST